MIRLTDQEIEAIAEKIARSQQASPTAGIPAGLVPSSVSIASQDLGVFPTVDAAVAAAKIAQMSWVALSLDRRRRIIAAIREVMLENAAPLAKAAHDETGLGRFEDKVVKNRLVAEKTPGIEELHPISYTGDHGLTLQESAPFGVIGAITPTTNPTSTIICNSIGMIAAGNSVAFNVHPNAKSCSAQTIVLLNKTIVNEGGPENLVTTVATPTIQSAQALMAHADVRLVVVTGGPWVVKAAQKSGKRAICAGPGNPPVVVDETADIANAAKCIVLGASTDNNIICTNEKEVIVVSSVADQLMTAFQDRQDAYVISPEEFAQLEKVIFTEMRGPRQKARINPAYIGKNTNVILRQIGLDLPDSIRLGVVEVNEDHPLLWTEQMMPIMPVTRVPDADYAIDLAIAMEGGCRHTAIMHSKNIDNLSRMARECNCSIFVKNGRSQAGLGLDGEGFCSFTIASPTGEGLTSPRSFSRWRRCTLVDAFRIT